MSKRMADTFFPACLDRINGRRYLSFLYHNVVFPEAIAEQCPEYIWNVDGNDWNVRQPTLLLAALWGMVIGMTGFRQLYSTKFLWAVALLTFGIMNLSATLLHCLWPAPRTDYPTDYPFLWVVDTYMTGVSGSCLLMASLEELNERWAIASLSTSTTTTTTTTTCQLVAPRTIFQTTVLIQLIGLGCIAWFLLDPIPSLAAASHPLELWYLVPPILAGGPVVLVLYEKLWHYSLGTLIGGQKFPKPRRVDSVPWQKHWSLSKSQAIFVSGIVAAGVLGIGMDRWWCPLLGYSMARDFLSANTMVFLGCDLAFWGIATFLQSRKSKLT